MDRGGDFRGPWTMGLAMRWDDDVKNEKKARVREE